MVSVVGLMNQIQKPLVDGLEEIAARLAVGESVPAEEIAVVLQRTRCKQPDLR